MTPMPIRRVPLFSASAAERAIACPASAALPRVNTTSAAAKRGTHIHDYLRAIAENVNPTIALERVPEEYRDTCNKIHVNKAIGDLGAVSVEAAFALHVQTRAARKLGVNLGRTYSVDLYEVAGTIDVIGTDMSERPVVLDWKTGQSVTPCKDNAQMLFAAVCAANHFGSDDVEARVAYVREDGYVHIDSHVFERFDLEDFVDRLAMAHTSALEALATIEQGGVPDVSPGAWCDYCPAMHSCPAHVTLVRAAASELDTIATRIAALTPEEGGKAWSLNKRIRTLSDTIDENLRKLAKKTPLPIGDTHEVREGAPQTRTTFDSKKLVALAKEKGATEQEIADCQTQTTFAPIREYKK